MVSDERFEFTAKAKKTLMILLVVGVVLTVLGYFTIGTGGDGHGGGHGAEVEAAVDYNQDEEPYGDGKTEVAADEANEASEATRFIRTV